MSSFVGTGTLVRLGLRRDRITLPSWLYLIVILVVTTAASFASLYPNVTGRLRFGASIASNPGLIALTGPIYDASTIGGLIAWRLCAFGAVLTGLMCQFTVVRHTRGEEEPGRLELIGAGVVGRQAPLTAALVVAGLANLLIAVLVAVVMMVFGQSAGGAIALGLAFALTGCCFAALAAVAAQLTETSRAANGIVGTAVGVAYLLRAIGDSAGAGGPTWLSWLSPIGWAERVQAFGGDHWWVLVLPVAFTIALTGAGYALVSRRDLGAGLLPARPGPTTAAGWLRSPVALAWRLQRGTMLAWFAGFAVYGAVIGAISQDVAKLADTSPQLKQIIDQMGGANGIVDAFLSAMLGLMGVVASAYTVQAVLRLRSEETALRAEPILATRAGRVHWAMSHVGFALLGTLAIMVAAGVGAGLGHGLGTGDVGHQLGALLVAALVQVPAAWVLAGITLALFGLVPALSAAAWGAVVLFLLLGQLGALLHLPQWAMDVSPFTHVPKLPGNAFTGTPMWWLVAVSAVFLVAGLTGFRRRDIG